MRPHRGRTGFCAKCNGACEYDHDGKRLTAKRVKMPSEQGHTPGPWHVGQGNGEGSVFSEAGRMGWGPGGTTLAPICRMIEQDPAEDEANARLIAAAPDLLAACEDAVATLVRWADNSAWDERDDLTIDGLRAAIVKAEGTVQPGA